MKPKKTIASVYLSRWAEGSDTRVTMQSALETLAKALGSDDALGYPWQDLRFEDVRGVPALLSHLKPASANKVLSALRGVLETAKDMGRLPVAEFARISVKNVRGTSEPAGRALSPEEKEQVIAALPQLSLHDAAVVAVLFGTGARRVEVVQVMRDHYDKVTGRILLNGKGQKIRKVPMGTNWRGAVAAWQATFKENERMFPFPDHTDPRRGVSYVVEKLCEKLGRKFTPHDVRRTFATHVCEAADPTVAQRLLGHADIKTTLLYDRRGEKAEDDAVKDW